MQRQLRLLDVLGDPRDALLVQAITATKPFHMHVTDDENRRIVTRDRSIHRAVRILGG